MAALAAKKLRRADPEAWREGVQEHSAPLAQAAKAAQGCRACELWERATQTVFGSGPVPAPVLLVGEQPGDKEDRLGEPFVGPAGRVLDHALVAAGIDRQQVYVTNVVKHFSWEARGKWRIHKRPKPHQIQACRPWLDAEIAAVHPTVIVCLGATAAQALLGRTFRVTQQRGEFVESALAAKVMATVHPSSLLRAPDDQTRERETRRFIADLKRVAKAIR
jgi:DNA polymerase